MGSTSQFALRFPELTDAPNGPEQIKALAEDADGKLARAFKCTSTTRPTVSDGSAFLIYETDTAKMFVWDGNSWEPPVTVEVTNPGGGGGGGGGGTPATVSTVSATYAATTAQPISSGSDVVVAFGVAQTTDTAVTRSASGAGHSFTLNQTRLWMLSATVRFATHDDAGGRTLELRAGSNILAKVGADSPDDNAWTGNVFCARKLTAGTVITAVVRHNGGSGVALEPNNGQFVHIDLAGV